MRDPEDKQERPRADQSFSKKDRLLQRSEFLVATRKGRRFSTRHFLLFLRPNRESRPRLGIVLSRKVGKAVHRNHVKRRVREFFRIHRAWFPPATDVVVVGKKGIPFLSYEDIRQDLERFLRSAPLRARKGQPKRGEVLETDSRRDTETV
jgi:ribonuclease P protein component